MPVIASLAESPPNPLQAPANLAAVVQADGKVKLTWDGVAGATTYVVERSVNLGVTWDVIAAVPAP